MSALSPSENIESMIRLLFRIQVREDKVFTRFLRILRENNFKIIDFDEALRRITGYSILSNIEYIVKILKEYALSYSFEVTSILKIGSKYIDKVISNVKELSRKGEFVWKLHEYRGTLLFVFHKHKWWLIQIIRNKGIVKITLLRKKILPSEIISSYYYTFYDIQEILRAKDEILDDLRGIISLLNTR